jgi:hypothetical protein
LNYKYKAEEALRASGLPYAIIRSSGIVPYTVTNNTRRVELGQGDLFSGRVTRNELATLVTEVLNNPRAVGKTFEVRRDESDSGLLGGTTGNWGDVQTDFNQLFDRLVPDTDRTVRGLAPFPFAQDPPPPPTPEQTQAILNDPRVVAVSEREAKEKATVTSSAAAAAVSKE